jgi:hypothetical protein
MLIIFVSTQLLASLIEDSDDVSQRMLDLLLGCTIGTEDDHQPARRRVTVRMLLLATASLSATCLASSCRRLAQAIMQRVEAPIRPSLQRFLSTLILSNPTDSELKDQRLDVIMQAF